MLRTGPTTYSVPCKRQLLLWDGNKSGKLGACVHQVSLNAGQGPEKTQWSGYHPRHPSAGSTAEAQAGEGPQVRRWGSRTGTGLPGSCADHPAIVRRGLPEVGPDTLAGFQPDLKRLMRMKSERPGPASHGGTGGATLCSLWV